MHGADAEVRRDFLLHTFDVDCKLRMPMETIPRQDIWAVFVYGFLPKDH